MAFKKHAQYPAALRFFELSKTAKSALFNLSSRIDANIADLLVKIRAAGKWTKRERELENQKAQNVVDIMRVYG